MGWNFTRIFNVGHISIVVKKIKKYQKRQTVRCVFSDVEVIALRLRMMYLFLFF
jgi:hypothetical protein